MEISLTEQSVVFIFSCVVGGLLGAFYDVFRIIRIAFNSKCLSIFFQDLIFCIFSAFSIILLVFYTNSGRIRWFSLFGCFICFVLYHLTIGRLIMFASKKIIDFIKKVLRFIYKTIIIPLKTTVLFILKQIKRLYKFILKIIKSSRIIAGKMAKKLMKIIKKDSVKNQKTLEKPKKKNIELNINKPGEQKGGMNYDRG